MPMAHVDFERVSVDVRTRPTERAALRSVNPRAVQEVPRLSARRFPLEARIDARSQQWGRALSTRVTDCAELPTLFRRTVHAAVNPGHCPPELLRIRSSVDWTVALAALRPP